MLTSEHLLQAFDAAGARGRLVYLSVPITSGRREIAILRRLGLAQEQFRRRHPDRWRSEVIEPNEEAALEHAERLRHALGNPLVVDPSRMVVAGWEQDDYNTFWTRLLAHYAVRLVAAPDWEYSRGARGEVAHAIALGLPVVDAEGATMKRADVDQLDSDARRKLLSDGWSVAAIGDYLPALDFSVPAKVETGAANQAFDWLVRERSYQVRKFGTDLDDKHTIEGLTEDGWWWRQLTSYYHRSKVLTLDTPVGRQALAKFVATACGLLESVVRTHGPLPLPGVPSGEVKLADD